MLIANTPIASLVLAYLMIICFILSVCYGLDDSDDDLFNDYVIACAVLTATALVDIVNTVFLEDDIIECRRVTRKRILVNTMFSKLCPYYVRQSYRMREVDFWNLLSLIAPYNPHSKNRNKKSKRGKTHYPNGKIHDSLCLSIAIRYFAGASPYNLMMSHSIGMTDVCKSIRFIFDAVNRHPAFRKVFPTYHQQQKESTEGFCLKSWVDLIMHWGC